MGVPVDVRLDRGHADHEEHEHGEGHHGEAQQNGSILPDARCLLLGSGSLALAPLPPVVLLLHAVEMLPVPLTQTHMFTHMSPQGCEDPG